jgi:hypothetical protein
VGGGRLGDAAVHAPDRRDGVGFLAFALDALAIAAQAVVATSAPGASAARL